MSNADYNIKSCKFHHLTEIQQGEIQAMMKLKVRPENKKGIFCRNRADSV